MFSHSVRSLLWVLLVSASCTAGDYEVTPCDPLAKGVSEDVCSQLNVKSVDPCQPFRCDAATRSCKATARDFDNDGDPDKICGGSDCNDFDPKFSGISKTCSCEGPSFQAPCSVGTGVCNQSAKYSCRDNTLYCTEPNATALDDRYMTLAQSPTGSWDWNCNGVLELGCFDKLAAKTLVCPASNCAELGINATTNDNDSCTALCQKIDPADPKCQQDVANFVICSGTCGMPVLTCHCTPTLTLGGTKCMPSGVAAGTKYQPTKSTIVCK